MKADKEELKRQSEFRERVENDKDILTIMDEPYPADFLEENVMEAEKIPEDLNITKNLIKDMSQQQAVAYALARDEYWEKMGTQITKILRKIWENLDNKDIVKEQTETLFCIVEG